MVNRERLLHIGSRVYQQDRRLGDGNPKLSSVESVDFPQKLTAILKSLPCEKKLSIR